MSSHVESVSENIPHLFTIHPFLTDDGCTDGTPQAALSVWPTVRILSGDGSLYWCRGMNLAWKDAATHDPDYYLLINDDTEAEERALQAMLDLCPSPDLDIMVVGAIRDPISGQWSYGGLQSEDSFPKRDGMPRTCKTMNANLVLIPRSVFQKLGFFFHRFHHGMGDMDYGLTASRAGIRILETPNFVAACSRNPINGTWRDTSLSRILRLQMLFSPKGLPPTDWWFYCRRNCGKKFIRYFFSPYVRVILGI